MIFNFSDQKNSILNNTINKFNKLTYKSTNSYRLGVLPNILVTSQFNEIHKKILFTDRIEKIQDYEYRWYLNDETKQIQNVKQILDLSFNYQYIPIKIEDDFIDFSTFPNKDIYTDYHTINNKRSSLLIKYDEIDRDYILYPSSINKVKTNNGRMIRLSETDIMPKYKSNELFKINIYSLMENPEDYFIEDYDKQLVYITIIKKQKKLLVYKKYYKTYDSITGDFNEYFNNINKSSKYIFETNDLMDELQRLKFLRKTQSNLGTNQVDMTVEGLQSKKIIFKIDNRWELKIEMMNDKRVKDISKDFIISIPILNIPTSREIYPYFLDRPISNYIDGKYDTDQLLNKRQTIKIIENKQVYNGGSF